MEGLVQELVDKAGLSREQAEKAIDVVKDYIMAQLPPGFSGMVENFLMSGGRQADDLPGQ